MMVVMMSLLMMILHHHAGAGQCVVVMFSLHVRRSPMARPISKVGLHKHLKPGDPAGTSSQNLNVFMHRQHLNPDIKAPMPTG